MGRSSVLNPSGISTKRLLNGYLNDRVKSEHLILDLKHPTEGSTLDAY